MMVAIAQSRNGIVSELSVTRIVTNSDDVLLRRVSQRSVNAA
jgi:hypothetical protein